MIFQSFFMSTTVQPFACASSSALSSRPLEDVRHGLAVSQLELRLAAAADDLLRGDTINFFRPRAHEFYPAAGHNEGLEPVGTQVGRSSSIG